MKAIYEYGYVYLDGEKATEKALADRILARFSEMGYDAYDVSDDDDYFMFGTSETVDEREARELIKTANRFIGQWNRNHK